MTRAPAVFAALAALCVVLFVSRAASAHKPSDAYLTLSSRGAVVDVRWDIAIRDLDFALGLDEDRDGKVTWGEVHRAEEGITRATLGSLALSTSGGQCTFGRPNLGGVTTHSDGEYAVLFFEASCPAGTGSELNAKYTFMFDVDPSHRAVVRLKSGPTESVHVLSMAQPEKTLTLAGGSRTFVAIVREGVIHIWTGYDHMLFLLALLLPAVLAREGGRWRPRDSFRDVFFDVARIVTAFTGAHSITLSLAALGLVTLPSRFVESVIALSVVIAAVNNLRPMFQQDRWMAAFVLGLMHGFGFSSTLADLGLARGTLLATLVGFNVGVELGQLAVVAVFLPLAFFARRTKAYTRLGLGAGSAVIAAIALVWLVERALDVKVFARLVS